MFGHCSNLNKQSPFKGLFLKKFNVQGYVWPLFEFEQNAYILVFDGDRKIKKAFLSGFSQDRPF